MTSKILSRGRPEVRTSLWPFRMSRSSAAFISSETVLLLSSRVPSMSVKRIFMESLGLCMKKFLSFLTEFFQDISRYQELSVTGGHFKSGLVFAVKVGTA